jgi:hypothetical protein
MAFNILEHLDRLTPDGGSNDPKGDHSFHCPACDAPNFKVNIRTGKWAGFNCDCANTEDGKRRIRNAVSPAINPDAKPPRQKQERRWDYFTAVTLERGAPALTVRRLDNPDQPDGNGWKDGRKIWQQSLVDGHRPAEVAPKVLPYGFAEATQALDAGAPFVFWVEGEPCVDALRAIGLPAVTSIGGAGKFKPQRDGGLFPSDQLVVCPDRDKCGLDHAEQVAASYPGCQWLYAFPGTPQWNGSCPPNKGLDIADWIAAGATAEQILAGIGPKQHGQKPPQPVTSKPKERRVRPMGHSRAMHCFERCIEVQAQRERNSLRRRARLLKAARDLGLATFINRQEIAQRVLEAKARCSGEGFKPLTAADRAAMPKPVVRWLVPGLIPANDLTIIGGRPKVGKTRLAVAIAAAVLRGEPFLEFPAASTTPPVLLVTDDQSEGDTATMLTALDLWTHPRLIWSKHFRLTENDLQALLDAIKANPGALVVLDSLRSIGRALQHGENDPEIGATLYDLKQAVIDAGGTLLLIHHCNKAADLVGVEALSGHNAIGGAANTVITFHYCPNDKGLPDKINPQRRLFCEGRSGEGCDLVIDRAGGGAYRQVSTFDHWQQQLAEAKKANKLEQLTSLQERVRDALEDSGEWMTRRQVCEAIGVAWTERGRGGEPRKVGDALTRLVALQAAESQRAGVEATFRSSRSAQNEPVTYETTVPPSDANGSQCHGFSVPSRDIRDMSRLSRTGRDTETPCNDSLARLSPMSQPLSDPLAPAPTWMPQLLQIRADNPGQPPSVYANKLMAKHNIPTDGRTVKSLLAAYDAPS